MKMDEKIHKYVFAAAISTLVQSAQSPHNFESYDAIFHEVDKLIPVEVPKGSIEYVIAEFIKLGIIETIEDDMAGIFYKIIRQSANNYVNSEGQIANSLIYKYRVIGPDFLRAALTATQPSIDIDDHASSANVAIPASDRVVTLNHNEISEFDERSSEIIEAVEELNGIEGEPGLREILVGQLKAGRELIRAGCLKVYVLQVTIVDALKFLAVRYEHDAIGALAANLLAAFLAHFGLAG